MKDELNIISLTQKLVSFNTINPPGQEGECALYIGNLLKSSGFHVDFFELSPGRLSLIAKIGNIDGKNAICFAGHLDTVPLGDAEWTVNPFSGKIEKNKIYGRGTTDMKGGIAAKIITALRLSDRICSSNKGLLLIFVASEETGCQGAYHLSENNILGTAGAIIVGEPTSNRPLIGNKATLWLEATTNGVAAHGSTPDLGENAITKAATAVCKIDGLDFGIQENRFLGKPTINIGKIHGGSAFNIVPDKATFTIDVRTIPGLSNDEILKILKLHTDNTVSFKKVIDINYILSDPENEWIQRVFEITETYLKEKTEPKALSGFTDASVLSPALGTPPTLILGPGELKNAHQQDEFCYISKIEEAVEIYTDIVKNWCDI